MRRDALLLFLMLALRVPPLAAQQKPTIPMAPLLTAKDHHLNATLYTAAGRFEQDPAAPLPILPGLDRGRELARLDPASDRYGFLRTQVVRERNRVADTLDEALDEIVGFLARSGRNLLRGRKP